MNDIDDKIAELDCLARWAVDAGFHRVRDYCRLAQAEIRREMSRRKIERAQPVVKKPQSKRRRQ